MKTLRTLRTLWSCSLLSLLVLGVASGAAAQTVAQTSEDLAEVDWRGRLDTPFSYMQVDTGPLRRVIAIEKDGTHDPYFTLTYAITNTSDSDLAIFPAVWMETETEKDAIDVMVESARERMEQAGTRKLRSSLEITRDLRAQHAEDLKLSGGDPKGAMPLLRKGQTVVGLAVFDDLDPAADHLEVLISGLTDSYRLDTKAGKMVVSSECFSLSYYRPGSPTRPDRRIEQEHDGRWRFCPLASFPISEELIPEPPI